MPPRRGPLAPIHSNRVQKKELTPFKRHKVVGASKLGGLVAEVAIALHEDKSTVDTILRRAPIRTNGESLPCPGWPSIYNTQDIRRLVQCVQNHPKYTYTQVRNDLLLNWSN
ncbi:hypothetical protein BJ878DRAFT_417996 [Calycina marina]|uniref:Uncharacterized protein n=1 Tax=Calycina marina TaxID=1763456 RepID=A0A9P7Z5J1_9HELO|nr:hypothetical protein BJ878DRAFT_417996 [Calycina marina]